MDKGGDLSCSILKKELIDIIPKESANISDPDDLYVKNESNQIMKFSLEKIMELFASGIIEKNLKQ